MSPPRISPSDRLLRTTRISGDCLIWTGPATKDGYGVMTIGRKKQYRVHRIAYEIANGEEIPPGLLVCHRCDTPLCVNPDHLFLGTARDNMRDMIAKGRKVLVCGADNFNTKLSPADRAALVARRKRGESLKSIAASYGIAFQTVSQIFYKEIGRAAG